MLKAISLYTGIGGLDFGFEAAGFKTAVAVDLDADACEAVRRNRNWPVLEGDIDAISSKQILKAADLKPGEADILIGGPPCQPFSKSGYWANGDARRLNDPRAGTLAAYLRVLRDTRPRAFLLENVHGFVFKGKDEGLQHFEAGLAEVNRQVRTKYRIHWQKLNAADYGVPQMRERVFLIGSRDGGDFVFPKPTHAPFGNDNAGGDGLEPYRTAWDAIGDLPALPNDPQLAVRGKWADLLPTIPEGENYLWHTNRGGGRPLFGWRRRYWSFMLKLGKAMPSWTIQAQPGPATGPFHWSNRKLSAQELCRLQTFPHDIALECSHAEGQRLVGNAVPSLLAEILAREIRRQLLGRPMKRAVLTLLPPVRSPVPAPERPAPFPAKYRKLVGNHADHPGEGQGEGARRRAASRESAAAGA